MTDAQYAQLCKGADERVAAKKRGETSSAYLAKLAAMSPMGRKAYLAGHGGPFHEGKAEAP